MNEECMMKGWNLEKLQAIDGNDLEPVNRRIVVS